MFRWSQKNKHNWTEEKGDDVNSESIDLMVFLVLYYYVYAFLNICFDVQ